MKRDMDLIRKLVLAVEAAPGGFASKNLSIEGYSDEQVAYHSYLVMDAGLALGVDMTHMGSSGPEAKLTALTWEGHEFADASRDERRWRKARGIVSEKAGTVTLKVLSELLTAIMRGSLGLG